MHEAGGLTAAERGSISWVGGADDSLFSTRTFPLFSFQDIQHLSPLPPK